MKLSKDYISGEPSAKGKIQSGTACVQVAGRIKAPFQADFAVKTKTAQKRSII
ncbi:MAG: hypothetical protein II579_04665 [Treponema sp.]|nr:hypothetical protein [Treponema sp.]